MVNVEASRAGSAWRCRVEVSDEGSSTTHSVSVSQADLARWGRGDGQAAVEDLVRRSFAFLLEREPAGSILRTFELAVIPRYFPEYDAVISGSER